MSKIFSFNRFLMITNFYFKKIYINLDLLLKYVSENDKEYYYIFNFFKFFGISIIALWENLKIQKILKIMFNLLKKSLKNSSNISKYFGTVFQREMCTNINNNLK